jgi:hypothetical protein
MTRATRIGLHIGMHDSDLSLLSQRWNRSDVTRSNIGSARAEKMGPCRHLPRCACAQSVTKPRRMILNMKNPPMAIRISAWAVLAAAIAGSACSLIDSRAGAPQLARADGRPAVVLLGEVHDNAVQHALRLEAFKTLLTTGARPALLLEQLDRERQVDIDRVRAGPTRPDARMLVDAGSGSKQWNWDFYRPFIELAIAYDLPVLAANVSRQDAQRVMTQGLADSGFDASVPPDITLAHASAIESSHCGMIDAPRAQRMASDRSQRAARRGAAGWQRPRAHRHRCSALARSGHAHAQHGDWLSGRERRLAHVLAGRPRQHLRPGHHHAAAATRRPVRSDAQDVAEDRQGLRR